MSHKFSLQSKDYIRCTKNIAIRYNSEFIGIAHFILALNAFNKDKELQIKIGYTQKKEWLNRIKSQKSTTRESKNYPLSKQMEHALKSSNFHRWIVGKKVTQPEHIYLGIVGLEIKNKQAYIELIQEKGIRLNVYKKMRLAIFFNKTARMLGITSLTSASSPPYTLAPVQSILPSSHRA